MKRTRGTVGREDVTPKLENHYHVCNGANSMQGLELPKGDLPELGNQEILACWSKCMAIWSPILLKPPATRASADTFRARISIVLPSSYFKNLPSVTPFWQNVTRRQLPE